MIEMVASGPDDLDRIQLWSRMDPWHHRQDNPAWWLTGNGFLSCRVQDEYGTIGYVRIDQEDGWYRLHCQFGPPTEVSRHRLVSGLGQFFKVMPQFLGGKGLRFNSESPRLIQFLTRWGFKPSESGDYVRENQVREN